MERVECCGVAVDVPSELCRDLGLLLELISPDTWNNHLTDDHREMLMGFLPDFPENDLEEKTRTLEMFFMDESFRFGTPLRQFQERLCKGHFNPEIAKMRALHKKILFREYKYRMKQYLHHTLEETLVRRKRVLDLVTSMPPDDVPRIPRLPPLHNKRKSSRTSIEYRTKKRYFRELASLKQEIGDTSDLSEDEIYPEGPGASLNKKQRRQLGGLEGSLPPDLLAIRATHSSGSLALDLELKMTPTSNPLDLTDDHFRAMLAAHRARRSKRESSVELDTRGLTLQEVAARAQVQPRRPPHRHALSPVLLNKPTKKKPKIKKEPSSSSSPLALLPPTIEQSPLPLVKTEPPSESDSSGTSSSESSESESEVEVKKEPNYSPVTKKGPPLPKNPKIKAEPLDPPTTTEDDLGVGLEGVREEEVDVKEEPMEDHVTAAIETSSELTAALESIGACIAPELTQETHICFFSLIRDMICSTGEQRMTRAQLQSSIRVWQESAISPLNEWYSTAASWVSILPSAINFLCGHFADVQPADFVPYIEYKGGLRVYQWIGAGRDSDGHLEPLAQFWLANRSSMSSEWMEDDSVEGRMEAEEPEVIPAPRCYTSWTVQPASEAEKEAYRAQEKLRYEKPHKAFTFRMHGYESVVGPVKGIYTQQTGLNKARGHSLLVPDRPAYVTILSLVRDAVARLPNGEGTRSDICELLKESQYLAPLPNPQAENNLNSVVSGALDRLHYENDPCVKYDTPRKLWIYLHRNRNEEEFERMHHLNGPGGSKTKKPAPRRQSRAKPKDTPLKPPPNVVLDPLATPKIEDVGVIGKVKPDSPVKLDTLGAVGKGVTSVRVGGVRGALGASSVQTIQVSTTGGVQTIKVALPPGAQTLAKVTPQTLAKVSPQTLAKVTPQALAKVGPQTLAKVSPQTLAKVPASSIAKVTGQAAFRGSNPQLAKGVGGSPLKGVTLQPSSLLQQPVLATPTQDLTTITGTLSQAKNRSPVVTLTTREAARLPGPTVSQARPAAAPATSTATHTPATHATLASQVASGGKLSNATVVNMSTTAAQKANLFSLGGIKLLQATPHQVAAGKSGGANSPVVVNSITKLQTLMVDGKVLVQGGKVVQAGGAGGKQVISGVLPGQQMVTVESLLSQADKVQAIHGGGGVTTVAGNKLAGGNVIQLTGGAGGVQRLTLVSPQGVPLSAGNQRLVLATSSQAGKLDGSGKGQVVQTIQTLQPSSQQLTTPTTTTSTPTSASNTTQVITAPITSTRMGGSQARFFSVGQQQKATIVQGLSVAGKPVLSGGGIRLVQPGGSGTTASVVAGASTATGNLITIGGKQVLLTSKPFAQQGQLQQVMLTGANMKAGGQVSTSQGAVVVATSGAGGQQGAVVVPSGSGAQQIVLPASALQGSHLNLKGLQAFQTLKVIPASQVTHQQRGKPVLARIVSPAAIRGATQTVQAVPSSQTQDNAKS